MEKKIIVKVSAGLGNQMFMYAHAYALSKKLNYKLYVDNTSGYFQKKNLSDNRSYKLNHFNINASIADKNLKYDNYSRHFLKKLAKFLDKFWKKKLFLIEHIDQKKATFFKKNEKIYSDKIYVEGYYECEKYFLEYRNSLLKQFALKNEFIDLNNKYINMLKDSNSVSIHVRRNRFVEPEHFSFRGLQDTKRIHLDDVFSYIKKSVSFFESIIDNPKFFIWSNNFTDLEKIFDKKKFVFVKNNNAVVDFHLFKFSKHFIVGPSSFHWWGAWLNSSLNKICVRPPDSLNPSHNIDFWPSGWKMLD